MRILDWFRKLRRIVNSHDGEIRALWERTNSAELVAHKRISEVEVIMRQRTEVSADFGLRGRSTIIVAGRYKNTDYVETFTVEDADLPHLIQRLKDMQRFATVRRVDAPLDIRRTWIRNEFPGLT